MGRCLAGAVVGSRKRFATTRHHGSQAKSRCHSQRPSAHSPYPAAHRADGPDPELAERPKRRTFTADYKLKILAEVDAATEPGEIGALLPREE